MIELSCKEDCDSIKEAALRMTARQIQNAIAAVVSIAPAAVD